jgi:sterol desaturase/sphingolipid hydroxylase (fatty acid hydroxylase superfamily)
MGKNVHIISLILYAVYRIIEGHDIHSGYEFPWSVFRIVPFGTDATYHHFHHSKRAGNFSSSLIIWDSLLSSNLVYYKLLESKVINDESK